MVVLLGNIRLSHYTIKAFLFATSKDFKRLMMFSR